MIYKITSLSTGRVYVGTSKNPRKRFSQHIRCPPLRMREVHRQFGQDDFVLTWFAGLSSFYKLDLEGFYIKKYNAAGPQELTISLVALERAASGGQYTGERSSSSALQGLICAPGPRN